MKTFTEFMLGDDGLVTPSKAGDHRIVAWNCSMFVAEENHFYRCIYCDMKEKIKWFLGNKCKKPGKNIKLISIITEKKEKSNS